MLNTMSKIRGQVNNPGYPQAEGLLGECMAKYGRELGEDTNFGKMCVCILVYCHIFMSEQHFCESLVVLMCVVVVLLGVINLSLPRVCWNASALKSHLRFQCLCVWLRWCSGRCRRGHEEAGWSQRLSRHWCQTELYWSTARALWQGPERNPGIIHWKCLLLNIFFKFEEAARLLFL